MAGIFVASPALPSIYCLAKIQRYISVFLTNLAYIMPISMQVSLYFCFSSNKSPMRSLNKSQDH